MTDQINLKTGNGLSLNERAFLKLIYVLSHFQSATIASHKAIFRVVVPSKEIARKLLECLETIESLLPTSLYIQFLADEDGNCCPVGNFWPEASKFEKLDNNVFLNNGHEQSLVITHFEYETKMNAKHLRKILRQDFLSSLVIVNERPRLFFSLLRIKFAKYKYLDNEFFLLYISRVWKITLDRTPSLTRSVNSNLINESTRKGFTISNYEDFLKWNSDYYKVLEKEDLQSTKVKLASEVFNFLSNKVDFRHREKRSAGTDHKDPVFGIFKEVNVNGCGTVSFGTKILKHGNLRTIHLANGRQRQLAGEYFLMPTYNQHHSHMMVETIGQLPIVLSQFPDINFLAFDSLTESERNYFDIFPSLRDRIIYVPQDETINVERLITSNFDFRYEASSLEFFDRLTLPIEKSLKDDFSRIYLSRSDSRVYRNMINEKEIESIFISFGFRIVVTSELSATEKFNTFRNAKYIAGPLGAAFHYLLFSRGAIVIPIYPDSYSAPEIESIWIKPTFHVSRIHAQSLFLHDELGGAHSSFFVNPDFVYKTLTKLESKTI
jgi:hypothetical protein